MSNNDKHKSSAAKEIATAVLERRRDKQYQIMIDWRDGKLVGIKAIEEIVNLEHIIDLVKDDFKPPVKPSEKK